MLSCRRPSLLVLLLAVFMGPPLQAQRLPADVPVADFFRWPALDGTSLSPDGTRLAMLVPGPDGRNALAIAQVETPHKRVGIAKFSDADIESAQWVNDRRLVLTLVDRQAPLGEQMFGGLYAVNADGSDFVFLVGRGRDFESEGHVGIRPLRWNHFLLRTLDDGSDDVVVLRFNPRQYQEEAGGTTLLRLNTTTRATRELVQDAPGKTQHWVFDRAGIPRAALRVDDAGQAHVLLRDSPTDPWRTIKTFNYFAADQDAYMPVDFDVDGRLVVKALRGDAARTTALFRLGADHKPAAAPILALQGYDAEASLVFDRDSRSLIGAHTTTDAPAVVWFDADMRALQERVDQLLPGTNNLLQCRRDCKSRRLFVVEASSDRQPTILFLFDRSLPGRQALRLIGPSRPWIDAAAMASQDMHRIPARDGLELPVYVTKPQGKGPWPTVMLVHGGPYVRGHAWGWHGDDQFLASRGYLVVQPEYRGSTGYGDRLFRAGWRQWGLTMQDDVTDAARWAVAQGWADPRRIAIAGASYGGYAAMMGLVKDPDFYRAAVNWVGVTDIDLLFTVSWSDISGSAWQRYGMPRLVGDPVKDKAQFAATSPLQRAAEITKPVLMAYGSDDRRVPLPHGTRMRDALRAAGKVDVEWVAYAQEGHGFMVQENLQDFWGRVERFLARHLRSADPPK